MKEPTITQISNVLYSIAQKWKESSDTQRKLSNQMDDASWCMSKAYSECRDDILKLADMIQGIPPSPTP